MVDMLEPWILNATLVLGTLAAVNIWLLVLSTKRPPDLPATNHPPQRHTPTPNP